MGDSELQILISAVDEASATLEEVNASLTAMAETADEAGTTTSEALDSVSASATAASGIIQTANQAQADSFALAAEIATQSDQEIIDAMLEFGVNAQTAASIVAGSNEEIAESSAETATLSRGSFTSIGVAAGIAFYSLASAVSNAVSSAQEWDIESATIATELKDIGSSIPLSQIQAYAQQVQSTTLLTQQQALQAEGLILGFKSLAPNYQELTMLSADLATKMSQISGTMADNLPNAAKILTNALTNPEEGFSQLIRQGNVDIPVAMMTIIDNMAKAGDTAGAASLIIQALQNSVGGVAVAAANAPGGGLTQLNNQLTALGTTIANSGLLADLDTMARDLIPIIQEVGQWAAEHPKLTEAIIAGTIAFTALLAVLAVVGIVFAALGSAIAFPMIAIAAVIALVVAAIIGNWNTVASVTETVWNGITTFFTAMWNANKNLFTTSLNDVKAIWTASWTEMSSILQTIWQTIENIVKTGVDDVISAINAFINALDAIHISIPSIGIPGTKLATPAINLGFTIPDIPMLADGGFVTQPTLALIGEAGPEAVIPLSSGAGAAGTGQVIQIFIQGGNYLDSQGATMIGNALAKQIITQLRVTNYRT